MNTLLISLQEDLDVPGLKSLHYILLKNGYNSALLHLPRFNFDNPAGMSNIGRFIRRNSPAFIGISLMSLEYYNACKLTAYLKSNFKSIPVIWGGAHPTFSLEMCVGHVDYACVGECENVILDIAKAVENGADLRAVNNICYKSSEGIIKNKLYPLVDDLDSIPAYDHLPVNSFIRGSGGDIVNLDRKNFRKYARYKGTTYSIMSSRGCPFSCSYCCNSYLANLYQTKKIRRRSVETIISELEKGVGDNPEIKCIIFQDDCFMSCDNDYLEDFCRLYKKRVKRPFHVRAIPIFVNQNKIKSLKEAGLSWINLGLQSGSDRVCGDIYKRKSLKDDFLKAAAIIKSFKIAPLYDVILDNPFEADEDRFHTVRTLAETPRPFYPQFFSLSFFPGTELHERAAKECPDAMDNILSKNYLVYRKSAINNIIRLSAFLGKRFIERIVYLYKDNKAGLRFKVTLYVANLFSSVILEPLAYFAIIRLSENNSFPRAVMALPNYFKQGVMRYLSQYRVKK